MPTVYRGTVFGITNIIARVGGILAPLVSAATKSGFMYIFGALGITAGILSFLLRETKGKLMADRPDQTQPQNERVKLSVGEKELAISGPSAAPNSFLRRPEGDEE